MDAAAVIGKPAYTFTMFGHTGKASCTVIYEAGSAVQVEFDQPDISDIDIECTHYMSGSALVVNVEVNKKI